MGWVGGEETSHNILLLKHICLKKKEPLFSRKYCKNERKLFVRPSDYLECTLYSLWADSGVFLNRFMHPFIVLLQCDFYNAKTAMLNVLCRVSWEFWISQIYLGSF